MTLEDHNNASDNASDPGGAQAIQEILSAAGINGRRLRYLLSMLIERPVSFDTLVRESAVEHRTASSLVNALGDDLVSMTDGRLQIVHERADQYRELINHRQLFSTTPDDPLGRLLDAHSPAIAKLTRLIEKTPASRKSLDHVSATAETAVRRALWLECTFDLDNARVLCIGDHDLTSVAIAEVNPRTAVTVVDIDDDILGYIDSMGYASIRCLWFDFRYGLAPSAEGWADLVFTDPPYTPEGVKLFLGRGVQGLRNSELARLVMAYGFSEMHPALGLKVQRAAASLHLTFDTILPGFNSYHGAQAVGSRSSIYVLRPTSRTWRAAYTKGKSTTNIYTHGSQSIEREPEDVTPEVETAVTSAAASNERSVRMVGTGWPSKEATSLKAVLLGQSGSASCVAVNLISDPGGWLFRLLLAVNATRLAILVSNNHPAITNEKAQKNLQALVASKYKLKLCRSTPNSRYAIVEADVIEEGDLDLAERVVRGILDRAHGKVQNTWRESVIRAAGTTDKAVTKNEARELIEASGVAQEVLASQLLTLPRDAMESLIRLITRSVPDGGIHAQSEHKN
ncbi:MAG: bis-aminopropyl spermidine synthase family protein [Gammaproteobacteria bacterium]|nr:bis-aminopropyl spermidine synthase family protein [Gammaproteobacteria bacterium]